MVDLIPIGTVNRTAAENNAVKNSDNVKEAAQSERMTADQKQKIDEPRRRFKRRQGDRRLSARGMRFGRAERRKSIDRRDIGDEDAAIGETNSKKSSRKGRIIDERA